MCNIEAGVNAGARGRMEVLLRCHNSPRRNEVTSRTGRVRRFCENLKKLESWVLDAKREGSTFGARRLEANLRPMGGARVGG